MSMTDQPTESRYLNVNSKGERLPAMGKADALIADGAQEVAMPLRWPKHLATSLVVVVHNGDGVAGFDAALHVRDSYQWRRVMMAKAMGDALPTRWLLYAHAEALSQETSWPEQSAPARTGEAENGMAGQRAQTAEAPMSTKCLKRPCSTCPFARTIPPGKLGGSPVRTYVGQVAGPFWLPCHSDYVPGVLAKDQPFSTVQQCAGAAQFRGNVADSPHLRPLAPVPWPEALHVLPKDTTHVFASFEDFVAHHLQLNNPGDAEWWLRVNPPLVLLHDELAKDEVKVMTATEGGAA